MAKTDDVLEAVRAVNRGHMASVLVRLYLEWVAAGRPVREGA